MKEVEGMEDSFVPLWRRSGVLASDFMRDRGGRMLVIWGAGMLGRCLMHQIARYAAPGQMLVFTDSNPALAGATFDGHVVLAFDEALRRVQDNDAFLLVALAGHTRTALARLADVGLATDSDYESYLKLSRPEAIVQVAGRDGAHITRMPVAYYRAVLAKLKADIPDLFHVDLSGWGDPLDHPDIDTIVDTTREVVPCTLTTRLDGEVATIERALLAAPTQFVIAVDGDSDAAFFDRLRHVAALKDNLVGRTEIRVKYNRYRDNGAGLAVLRPRCAELGLKLVEAIGYIDPYDTTLALCESDALNSAEAARLAWSLRDALDLARADRARPCLCQRIFPVISPDGSAGVCHLYAQPRLHADYLALTYDALLDLRRDAMHCRVCQHHALHRLDVDVLQARHAIPLINVPETACA
jgi:hypothetical protein